MKTKMPNKKKKKIISRYKLKTTKANPKRKKKMKIPN